MARAEEGINETAFVVWMTRNPQGLTGLFIAILYVLVVSLRNIPELGSISIFSEYSKYERFYNSIPCLIQCVALTPALWWCFRLIPPTWSKDQVANRATIQFTRCLASLIATWIVFYLINFLTLNQW